jgi:hypothetical protein
MAQAVSSRPLTMEARGSVPGQVHVRFVVDNVALGQVFLRVVGFPLSISFHWCYLELFGSTILAIAISYKN